MVTVSSPTSRPPARSNVRVSEPGGVALSWILLGWVVLSLLIGSVSLGEGIYLSQPLQLAIIGLLTVVRFGERRVFTAPIGAIIILIAISLPLISGGTANDRFVPEQVKILMLIAGAMALGPYMTWRRLYWIACAVPPILCAIIAVTWATGAWDYYGGGRFGVPLFGSPNSTAFVVVVALALSCYVADSRGKFHLWDAAIIAFLIVTLVRTESDGGLVSVLFLTARYFRVPMKIIVPGAFAMIALAMLMIFLFSIDVPELLGSGRLFIWETLIGNLMDADPVHMIFGFGPGAVDLEPGFTASIRSAHSMFLEVTYSYGLLGLAAMSYAVIATGIRLSRASLGPVQRRVLEGLYVALLAGAFVDAYFVTAQLVWLGSLALAFFALIGPGVRSSAASRRKIGSVSR